VLADVAQQSKDILGAIGNLMPQSGSGGSPALPPGPSLGSASLNLAQNSSTMNGVLIPPGS
jgi:hypothetical protein